MKILLKHRPIKNHMFTVENAEKLYITFGLIFGAEKTSCLI